MRVTARKSVRPLFFRRDYVNHVAQILTELVADYFNAARNTGRDCRLVVPGLTAQIADALHKGLTAASVPSYLVVPRASDSPDREQRKIFAEGLTSKREGSFVAVSYPGELSRIQDSVLGAGGACLLAFSDEWPWIDNGMAAFQFDGPFLNRLVSQWSQDLRDRSWFTDLIHNGVIPCTANSQTRGVWLLEGILAGFNPTIPAELAGVRERFLFHCGIPNPIQSVTGEASDIPGLLEELGVTCAAIVKAHQEPRKRSEVFGRVDELYPEEDKRAELRRHLEVFFDGLGDSDAPKAGILYLSSAWGQPKQPGTWTVLSSEMLRRLFDIVDPVDDARIRLVVTCPDNGILSAEDRFVATFHGETIALEIVYSGLPTERATEFGLRIDVGRTIVHQDRCTGANGTSEYKLDTATLTQYKGRIALVARLVHGEETVKQWRIALHLCGESRPQFAVISPTYKVVGPDSPTASEEIPKYEINEAAEVYVFDNDNAATPKLFVAESELGLVGYNGDRLLVSEANIDASESPAGIARIRIEGRDYTISADLEASASRTGEFTLEDELRVRIVAGSQPHLRKLVPIFREARERYVGLGGLSSSSWGRVQLGKLIEKQDDGHLPTCANILDGTLEASDNTDGYLRRIGNIDLRSISGNTPSQEVQQTVASYASARRNLFDIIFHGALYTNERPRYAELPVYIESRAPEIASAITKYLECYALNIQYLREHNGQLNWTECFLLTYLDCVVHWGSGDSAGQAFLLGPWHPLVVAKRFMMQKALVLSAKKFLAKKARFRFHALAALIGQHEAFSWVPHLDLRDRSIGAAYVSSTSDPGWMLCLNHGFIGQIESIVAGLRESLGLDGRVLATAKEHMAESYMKNFLGSYPSRRSLGIRVAAGYATEQVIESTESMLYGEEGPTGMGTLLPGGVHVFFTSKEPKVPELAWRKPPLCIYGYEDDDACASQHPLDIALLSPPSKITFAATQTPLSLPRGREDFSFAVFPLRQSMMGADGVPVSTVSEWETNAPPGIGLGDVFVRVLHQLATSMPNALRTSWRIDLPKELKSHWNVLQGQELDPSAFVQYVDEGFRRYGQPRALWDYRISITKSSNSYFILSRLPDAIQATLNGSPVFEGKSLAIEIIRELGMLGLAIGGESVRSAQKALGVIGLVGAIRLFSPGKAIELKPLRTDALSAGFLLPVDSFHDLLGTALDEAVESHRRADLVAIQIVLPRDEGRMQVRFAAIECKYSSGTYKENFVPQALEQATQTYERLATLFAEARMEDGLPERLAVANLLGFGLRLIATNDEPFATLECRVLSHIANGTFDVHPPKSKAILVSTECSLSSSEIRKRNGWWIRLGTGHWPGVTESESTKVIRQELGHLFFDAELATPAVVASSANVKPDATRTAEVGATPIVGVTVPQEVSASAGEPLPVAGSRASAQLLPILLGVEEQLKRAFYDPQSQARPLDNYNVMITGSSGKGKTQLIKALVLQLRAQGRNVFLLDFKNDFAGDSVFCREAALETQFVTFDGLPYNPLIPFPLPHPGTRAPVIHCGQHITGLTAVLARAYGLGTQQEMALKEAVRECYREVGLNPSGTSPYEPNQPFPDFNDAGNKLRTTSPRAYNRLDPLFDLQIFQEQYRKESFASVLRRSLVIDLSSIQSDQIKNALAQMMVLSAHSYYNSQPHSPVLRQYLIFDEAHRVLGSEYLTRFVRECRAYGVGTVLSSQYPTDFGPDVSASLSTKIIHGNDADETRVHDIANLLGMRDSESKISNLAMFEAILSNSQHRNSLLRTIAYPHQLVLRRIAAGGTRADSLGPIEGLNEERMPAASVLEYLKQLGMVEEVNGVVKPL